MAKRKERYGKLYDALCQLERESRPFSVADLAQVVGYKESSLRVYMRNKLNNVYMFSYDNGLCVVRGVCGHTQAVFAAYMSQKTTLSEQTPSLAQRLIERSVDSFYLAIENYNRPTLSNRMESFCIMMTNAWELLMKALLIKQSGENAVLTTDGYSITVAQALKKLYPKPDNPVRGNLELVIDLRNQATHLLIEECSAFYFRWFQSCVINYIDCLTKAGYEGKLNLSSRGLILVADEPGTVEYGTIRRRYGGDIEARIKKLQESLGREEQAYASSQYAIPVEYRVCITKDPSEGQVMVSINNHSGKGYFVEVPRDPERTHVYRETDVLVQLKTHIPGFTQTGFRAIVFCEKIKQQKVSNYHYYFGSSNTHKYSEALVNYIVAKCGAEPTYVERCVSKYKSAIKARPRAKV